MDKKTNTTVHYVFGHVQNFIKGRDMLTEGTVGLKSKREICFLVYPPNTYLIDFTKNKTN